MAARFSKTFSSQHTFANTSMTDMIECLEATRTNFADDPNLVICEDKKYAKGNKKGYYVEYVIPEFIKVIFKLATLKMYEVIDFGTGQPGSVIRSYMQRDKAEINSMNLETTTEYKVENKSVVVNTLIKITLPFQIPPFLIPAVNMFTKEKTSQVRTREMQYLNRSRRVTTTE